MQKTTRLAAMGLRSRFFTTLIGLAWLMFSLSGQAQVTLEWNANPEPDIAGYKIHIGTSSGDYTTVMDVGNATSHVVTDLAPSTTYYFAVQAYNVNDLDSAISGELPYTTMPAGAFGAWAASGSLKGMNASAKATPHHDGVPNLLKYAFNLNPGVPDARVLGRDGGAAGLPLITVDHGGQQPMFRVEFLRRTSGDLIYTPKITTDLKAYETMSGQTNVVRIDADWEKVRIDTPCDPSITPRMFGTVEVRLLP